MTIIILLALAALLLLVNMTFQVTGTVLVCLILLIVWIVRRKRS